MTRFTSVALAATLLLGSGAALAQDSSYDLGSVWYVTGVDVQDGQFETYMDYLAGQWRKSQEFAKKEGIAVDYRVLANTNPREGEPDLYLVVMNKDFVTKAQALAFEKKLNDYLAQDRRKADTAFGGRGPMRKIVSNMELQEMTLKAK